MHYNVSVRDSNNLLGALAQLVARNVRNVEVGVRLPYAPPKQDNPNLRPIGHGFGFIVLMEEIEDW